MIVGIDLHNIRDGGGPNYMRNLLRSADPARDGFRAIHLFGSADVLAALPDRAWIIKHAYAELAGPLPRRLWFVWRRLPAELRAAGCDILYAPGGVAFGNFRPYVTISRNMMPFRPQFWSMYPRFSAERLRLRILRRLNAATFSKSDGMIYLSETARDAISAFLPNRPKEVTVIPHGVDHERFFGSEPTFDPSRADPVRIVYPSRLEPYKHQLEVIAAFADVARDYPHASLTFCGPANPPYLDLVEQTRGVVDPSGQRIRYLGEVPNQDLRDLYAAHDILVFASSCENLPNILIEAMACGIPICCSDRSPMPEIAQNACLYFDPARPETLADCIRETLADREATLGRAKAAMRLAANYSWEKTARRTFTFIANTVAAA